MGMVGVYDAHFYCDVCMEFSQSEKAYTASEARQQQRECGWRFLKNGIVICDKCNPKDALPECKREGYDWHMYAN